MNKSLKTAGLWAKKGRSFNGLVGWLPLYMHLEETSAACGFLWEHWISDGVKDFIINSLDCDCVDKYELAKKICLFTGAVHDIGKATPIFQLKPSFNGDFELDSYVIDKLKYAGFEDRKSVV